MTEISFDPRIATAAAWLQSDDTAYELQPDAAVRAAREMLAAADAVQPKAGLAQIWQPIEEAPEGEALLMAAKPDGHLRWKYGIGLYIPIYHVLCDWPWAFSPTHFQRIVAPI